MGGMEDVGTSTPVDYAYNPPPSRKAFVTNPAFELNQPVRQKVTSPTLSRGFGNYVHGQQPRFGYDSHHPGFASSFTPSQQRDTSINHNIHGSSSYEAPQYLHDNHLSRSPNRHPTAATSKSPLGYRTIGTNQFSQQINPDPPSGSEDSPPNQWGEHPCGEHPSRTLFVRNINSNVEEAELKQLFEDFGAIRSMYTSCKHRGFVMISYYDIRHAKNAMRTLQGKNLRRRKLDIHYSIPKENPPEKDQNQGTLVVFNLDPSITKDELRDIFGVHGEIKEIRETPNKRHHKFIEFYDVRCAEQAMKCLNKTEIKSKKIKIEPSRPGGRKSQNSAPRDDNSLSNSPEHAHVSDFPHLSKSAPNQPNYFTPSPIDSVNVSIQRRQPVTVTVPSSQQPVWPQPPTSHHRPLRSISLPPNAPHPNSNSTTTERTRSRQDDKRQFALNITAVQQGIDCRTTLMIKNIPNKYTQKMLLSTVDETHKGLYDFFYLPIDFKNKCNVGYAFINFIDPKSIVSFYQQLHNTKWEKFNSEKVCNIAYARIQGKDNLIAHFQNSSLMSEDKKCRPIIFHSTGPKMGQQAPFPVGSNVRSRGKEEKRISQSGDRVKPEAVKRRSRSYSCK